MGVVLLLNGGVSLLTAAALTAVILNPRVHEGVLIKAGLIVMTLSLYASGAVSLLSDAPRDALVNSGFALRAGILIVCAGLGWRFCRPNRK
jgi:hypothetical protein